ncbi:hypothetical protein C8J57DRAFT_1318109, partial [Mycena rebaudengoi]
MSSTRKRKREDEPDVDYCSVCHEAFHPRAIVAHQLLCRQKKRARDQLTRDAQALSQRRKGKGKKGKGRTSDEKMPKLRLRLQTNFQNSLSRIPRAGGKENLPPPGQFGDPPQFEDPLDRSSPARRSPPPSPSAPVQDTAHLPSHFILTVYHKHSGLASKIVPLDGPPQPQPERPLALGFNPTKPFAPFRVFADYHFTSMCVRHAESEKQIKEQLDALHNQMWAGPCKLTIRTVKDMSMSLAAARQMAVQFNTTMFRVEFEGRTERFRGTHEIEFSYRDPWEVIKQWVRDPTLVPYSNWFSARKFYCHGGESMKVVDEIIDEPYTAETWRNVDDQLPDLYKIDVEARPPFPCVYLPLHIWLDKGKVSTKVKKHPILLRGLWIDSIIRNASGNGGCALLGYIVMPPTLRNVDRNTLSAPEKEDFIELCGKVYHGLNEKLLAPLKWRSHRGDTLRFGDGEHRTGFPGIEIQSMDFQEIAAWLGMRSSQANFPCPKCLVPKDKLHCLTRHFAHRTSASMAAVVHKAQSKLTKGEKEAVLKKAGLHNVEQILWHFNFSDPYKAVSYDTLHWDEGGKFGRHLWVYTKKILSNVNLTNEFNACMDQLPRWRAMEHVPAATTIDFAEGETWLTILKTMLPCLVHLLPRNSPLVRALRALQQFRMLVGMHCMTGKRLKLMERFIKDYDHACREIKDKDFDFLKQHYTVHSLQDIREKGTTNHMSTRTGEGFQQEVARHYKRTSGVNAEHQMVLIDENEEVIAQLDMIVADDRERQKQKEEDGEDNADSIAEPAGPSAGVSSPGETATDDPHWRLAAPDRKVALALFEAQMSGKNGDTFEGFDLALRQYLLREHPGLQISSQTMIYIQSFRALYVEFQSKVDWTGQHDILRCNESFWHRPRYDYVLYNSDADPLAIAQLLALFRCTIHNGDSFDLAFVQRFKNSQWRPNTAWDGCRVVDPVGRPEFLSLEHVARGVFMAKAAGVPAEHYFPLDTIDDDMFLRLNNID